MDDNTIRRALRRHFERLGASVVEEVSLAGNSCRLDMAALVDGVLCGIEIKSDADTLKRLPAQARRARPRFRRAVLVVGERHHKEAIRMLPGWWGIWVVRNQDDQIELVTAEKPARPALENPKHRPLAQAKMLRRNELHCVLERAGVDRRLLIDARRGELAALTVRLLSIEVVEHEIVAALRERAVSRLSERDHLSRRGEPTSEVRPREMVTAGSTILEH